MSELVARGLRAGYGAREVLGSIELTVGAGDLVAVVGPNGAGKSTLLRCLAGLVRPREGRVTLDGADLGTLGRREIARRIAVVPQMFDVLFPFTVREIVALGRSARLGPFGSFSPLDAAAVDRSLAELELADLAARRIDQISGGERQRVVLAMALAQETDVLLLDEPTAHLDPGHQRAILARVRELARARGLAVVAVLHDLNLAAALASRVTVLAGGRIVRDGPPGDVIDDGCVREVFGPDLVVGHVGRTPYVVPRGID